MNTTAAHRGARTGASRARVPVALSAALALALTACGNGASGSGASDSPAGDSTGVTDTEILLGTTQPLTGPAAPGYSKISAAMSAYFDFVNEGGGVNGR